MPDPIIGETRDEFIARCIPMAIEDGSAVDGEQAFAICEGIWNQHEATAKSYAVKMIKATESTAIVGGYGVIFGGLDIEGEGFKKSTDFMLDLVPSKVITFNHTLPTSPASNAVKHFIGKSITEKADDLGIWVEAQLDISRKYVKQVLQLVEKGLLGWSSATAPHLTTKSGNYYERWPIVEYALTPIPAEPRLLDVKRIKSIAAENPGLEIFLAQSSGDELDKDMIAGSRLQQKAKAFLLVNSLED